MDDMKPVALKPCPFCGGADIRFDKHTAAGRGPYHFGETVYSMCCYQCGATFPNRYRRELLEEAWNRRAPHPEPGDPVGIQTSDNVGRTEGNAP